MEAMHELMRAQPFATLVTLGSADLIASHIPMILEEDGSKFGVLKAHISKANPQWQENVAKLDALAIFAGAHHYISPTWYPSTKEHGKVVPTWNYAVVHAYGPLQIIHDQSWLLAHINALTDIHEANSPEPWKVSDAPAEYIQSLLKGIVGLEIPINRLEGKWKVSQNRPERDRMGVVQALAELGTRESLAMKQLVEHK